MSSRRLLVGACAAGVAATLGGSWLLGHRSSRGGRLAWHLPGTIHSAATGNSIAKGGQDGPESSSGVLGYLHRHVEPFSRQSFVNVAVGGQDVDDMIGLPGSVDRAFATSKQNVLVVQEGTNQIGKSEDPDGVCEKLLGYVRGCRSRRPWTAVALATAPPAYLGDQVTLRATVDYNQRLDAFNAALRSRWAEVADALIETRSSDGPFSAARYPDYRKSTFFDTAVVGGLSNYQALLTEPAEGKVPYCKIHPSAAAIAALAPLWASALLGIT